MRTADAALGAASARRMLDHLVATARGRGHDPPQPGNRLDRAIRRRQPPYTSKEGFERCGPFGGYADTPFTRFYHQGNLGPIDPRGEAAADGIVGVDMVDLPVGQQPADHASASPGWAKAASRHHSVRVEGAEREDSPVERRRDFVLVIPPLGRAFADEDRMGWRDRDCRRRG